MLLSVITSIMSAIESRISASQIARQGTSQESQQGQQPQQPGVAQKSHYSKQSAYGHAAK